MSNTQPTSTLDAKIERWRQKLIDLSRRNRLLYLKRTRSSTLIVEQPGAETIFEHLVLQEKPWTFWLPPDEDEETEQAELFDTAADQKSVGVNTPKPTELVCEEITGQKIERVLKNLYRRANSDYQERGVRILYAAFGELNWIEADQSSDVQSPLILCSVELRRETARDPYKLMRVEEVPLLNPALQVKLQTDFNIHLPAITEDWEEESLSNYLAKVSQLVAPLKWTVEPTTLISLFSFHKLVMYQDLASNANLVKANKLVQAIAGLAVLESDQIESQSRASSTLFNSQKKRTRFWMRIAANNNVSKLR